MSDNIGFDTHRPREIDGKFAEYKSTMAAGELTAPPPHDASPNPVVALFERQGAHSPVPERDRVHGFLNGMSRLISEGFTPEQIAEARTELIARSRTSR